MGSKMEQLRSVERMSGETPPELIFPEVCSTIAYILDLFYTLKTKSGIRITFTEIASYCNLMDHTLQPEEVSAIMQIDSIFEKHMS